MVRIERKSSTSSPSSSSSLLSRFSLLIRLFLPRSGVAWKLVVIGLSILIVNLCFFDWRRHHKSSSSSSASSVVLSPLTALKGGGGGEEVVEKKENTKPSSIALKISDEFTTRDGERKRGGGGEDDGSGGLDPADRPKCVYKKLQDLEPTELHPKRGSRHMVQPPSDVDTFVTLVCCSTSAGPLSIAIHPSWAPLGAHRFLHMVRGGYFSSYVPFMRCLQNFICQFGIAGDPDIDALYRDDTLLDDPNWLPAGPNFRVNAKDIPRFARGYMAYAGSGNHSRSNQFIVALQSQPRLGGGSPWEVPWGEVVGWDSFETLDRIYTGYGEDGPTQARLHKEGYSDAVAKDFPRLDYISACVVVDQQRGEHLHN